MAFLQVKHSTSKAAGHHGASIVVLVDMESGNRYRTVGNGYDRLGTCLGMFLQDAYQGKLLQLAPLAYHVYDGKTFSDNGHTGGKLYGMTHNTKQGTVTLDGGCGFESMLKIARHAGLTVNCYTDKHGDTNRIFVG